ncbi:MAG: hypothetical protein DMF89_17070 [Acidobacteria bacterium]|nr:MAG: hypothetical protein DMF89_17070 [Acidobacteriota bacterium]
MSSSVHYQDGRAAIDWLCRAFVDDVEAHCARARGAGASIHEEPALHDYGKQVERVCYGAFD